MPMLSLLPVFFDVGGRSPSVAVNSIGPRFTPELDAFRTISPTDGVQDQPCTKGHPGDWDGQSFVPNFFS
jgi:hypothetical protein